MSNASSSQAAKTSPTPSSTVARVRYEACPLCEERSFRPLLRVSCQHHPLWHEALPGQMEWSGCQVCGHVFTNGWFDDDGMRELARRTNAHQGAGAMSGRDAELQRRVSARIVSTVADVRGGERGRWLDVGTGNGSLLAAAEEFGFEALGIDLRQEPIDELIELGYTARQERFEELDADEPFDVISMADVLEHIPFPRPAVEKARALLRPGGVLFVSMPNMDTHSWRAFDREGKNPYWAELEHFHNFDRARLCALLSTCGLEPVRYGVSERYLTGMEVVALRAA